MAEGYEEGSTTLYKEISLADFVLSADPIGLLGSVHSLKCTKESSMFLKHPFTTDEVKNCFEDIKVLGKREIRLILKWREKMKEFLREAEKLEQFAAGNKHEADQSEKEEEEEEDMDERIEELRRTELSDSKRLMSPIIHTWCTLCTGICTHCLQVYIHIVYRYMYTLSTGICTHCLQVYVHIVYRYMYTLSTGIYTHCVQVYVHIVYRYMYTLSTGIYTHCLQVYVHIVYRYIFGLRCVITSQMQCFVYTYILGK